MQNTKVKQGQSFIDIICQATGSLDNVISEAIVNKKSITDDLMIGEEIFTQKEIDSEVIKILSRKNPSTNGTVEMLGENLEGIGNWIINLDFIVS
jgi:hypothetical protein